MNQIAGFNTLRFFAFLAIFLFHTTKSFTFGKYGVDFFFVLSSFLLTYLAFREIDQKGSFSKQNFFLRRVLRIFPLYYLLLLFSFFLLPILATQYGKEIHLPEKKWLYWFFLSNYETTDCLFALKFFWSIAVEEQFYLLFLLLSFFFTRNMLVLTGLLLTVYFLFMIYARMHNLNTYSHTLAHFPNFTAGMAAGYLFWKRSTISLYLLHLLVLTGIVCSVTNQEILFTLSLSVFFAVVILLTARFAPALATWIPFRITEKLGIYTYGLYVYSGFVITFSLEFPLSQNSFIQWLYTFLLLLLTAVISYHVYEIRFLQLKEKFRT